MTGEQRPADWAAWMGTSPQPAGPVPLPNPESPARADEPVPAEEPAAASVAGAPGDAAHDPDAPRSARREATRQRILDAARAVFAENGVIGGTVEDICERAGFTRGAFYSNFVDKDEVVEALVEREHNRLLVHLDASLAAVGGEISASEDLQSVLASIVDRILRTVPIDRQLSLVQTELEIFAIRRPDPGGRFLEINNRFRARIAGFIDDAMRGCGRELLVDPLTITDAIVAIGQGSVRRALLDGSGGDLDAMASAVLPALLLAVSRPATSA
jgi:AcrR family transcriptional regulator